MHADTQIGTAAAARTAFSPRAAVLGVGLCVAVVLAIFWPTTLSTFETWWRSATYQHCFFVIPIFMWLVWGQRDRLAATPAAPYWPGLLLASGCGLIWLTGVLAVTNAISQLALVGMTVVAVLTVFGLAWAKVLWFPLLFLFFAVPFGDALVPSMTNWTADFTVLALRATGVPIFREGNQFVIPSGSWSVVEACSGIKFLIASLMVGTLYAWLMYRSLARRVAFMLASIAVPFAANWLRAYLTVLIAHLTNNRWMLGIDHLLFGWILFAAALLALFWFGMRWREDDQGKPETMVAAHADRGRLALGALVALLALGIWPPIAEALLQPVGDPGTPQIAAPLPTAGWAASAEPIADWSPHLTGAAATATFTYQKGLKRVGLFVAAFRHQHESAKLATTINQFVAVKGPWMQTSSRMAEVPPLSATPSMVRAATLRGRLSTERLVAWQWYWVGDSANASDLVSKLELARARLLRRPDTGLWVTVFTPLGEGNDDFAGDEALADFLRSMDPSLRAAFARTTER